jgi:hypothetical protein
MGRRNQRSERRSSDFDSWDSERTLAAAEEEQAAAEWHEASETGCLCGSSELLLEAYLRVLDGRPEPQPVELGRLTCPHCGREYDAIEGEGGRVLRGEFLGYVELDD